VKREWKFEQTPSETSGRPAWAKACASALRRSGGCAAPDKRSRCSARFYDTLTLQWILAARKSRQSFYGRRKKPAAPRASARHTRWEVVKLKASPARGSKPRRCGELYVSHSNQDTGVLAERPFSSRSPRVRKRDRFSSDNSQINLETAISPGSASLHKRNANCTVAPNKSLCSTTGSLRGRRFGLSGFQALRWRSSEKLS
jgi:hypothetical protein